MKNNLHKNTKNELIDEILKLREKEQKLQEENQRVIEENEKLKWKMKDLKWEISNLEWEVKDKEDTIKDLEWKLNISSQNSSKPPSTETLQKKTQICNSRIKWKNPLWWVKWHTWANHKYYENPDIVTQLEVSHCEWCNHSLEEVEVLKETKRQVVDIPKPVFKVQEYQSEEKICPCCGKINKAKFPVWVEQEMQFWPNIQASSVYMYNYQMTSLERLQEFWKEMYGLEISQATLMNFNKKWFETLQEFENQLKGALRESAIIHSDETWVRIAWKTKWIHTVSNHKLTHYSAEEKRWKEALDNMDILTHFIWILISDHWWSYKQFSHFLLHCFCNAHHLRELTWVIENEEKLWARDIKNLLIKAKTLKEEAQEKWETFLKKETLKQIHIEFQNILHNWKSEYEENKKIVSKRWRPKKSKWLNLLERLEQSESWTLWFIDNFDIPFDNNLAERDLTHLLKTFSKTHRSNISFKTKT